MERRERVGERAPLVGAHQSGEYDCEQLTQRATAARPRLIGFARAFGIPAETAEDVAQETLLEAWRHLHKLHAPGGLESWLTAICRNVCLRHLRREGALARRQVYLDVTPPAAEDTYEQALAWQASDLNADDLGEALERQDLHTLLDRALAYLPAGTRELVERCYLEEQPQPEVAARLGLSLGALEARLHRARKQLRHVLSGELHAEAEAFGLLLNAATGAGWHETRLWCMACGLSRLHGRFELVADGDVNLHLRCPGCAFEVNSGGFVPLEGMRSFRPALKRMWRQVTPYVSRGLIEGSATCPRCGACQSVRLAGPEGAIGEKHWVGISVVMVCARCGTQSDTNAAMLALLHPDSQRFITRHSRWRSEPETLLECQGRPALHIRLVDMLSAARLTLLLDRQTLRVLLCEGA